MLLSENTLHPCLLKNQRENGQTFTQKSNSLEPSEALVSSHHVSRGVCLRLASSETTLPQFCPKGPHHAILTLCRLPMFNTVLPAPLKIGKLVHILF